ncbi:MAG: diadenylate cyclase CdaA [Oscillospiraceae bacterium]|nr:diadenylate cyclase CdaA [Oscillospiraceae bacterium]
MPTILWQRLLGLLNTVTLFDVIDVLLVAFIIFQGIRMVRETRAEQLFKGLFALLAVYLVSGWVGFRTLEFLLSTVLNNAVVVVLIIFQPEVRRILEELGRSKISNTLGMLSPSNDDAVGRIRLIRLIDSLCDSCAYLAKQRMGALIVIERETKLGEIIKSGTIIDADPSKELLGNIFFVNSPLHDGALVVRNGRLYAAGCFLPLSNSQDLDKSLGTRHRAGVGMSENSDALVLILSEETGVISTAKNGVLKRNYTLEQLNDFLRAELLNDFAAAPEKKTGIWRNRK